MITDCSLWVIPSVYTGILIILYAVAMSIAKKQVPVWQGNTQHGISWFVLLLPTEQEAHIPVSGEKGAAMAKTGAHSVKAHTSKAVTAAVLCICMAKMRFATPLPPAQVI